MQTIQSVAGIFALLALTFAISENHRAVSFRQAAIGLGLTVAVAVALLKIPQIKLGFAAIANGVDAIAAATRAGTGFVFGYVGGGPLPFELKTPGADFVLGFQALPIVLVMSVLTTLLFYWGILPPSFAALRSRCSAPSGSAARSDCRRPPTSFSAMSKRRSSSGPISESSRAANCSSS